MNKLALAIVGLGTCVGSCLAVAADSNAKVIVTMNSVSGDGVGRSIGQITIKQVGDGLEFEPSLIGLGDGLHGFHIHQNPDCGSVLKNGEKSAANAAGSHFDPRQHNTHAAPWDEGHLGDLPALYADANKRATHALYKSGIQLDDVKGRALIVHEGGDNYSDVPQPLGGGGKRIACGIIPE